MIKITNALKAKGLIGIYILIILTNCSQEHFDADITAVKKSMTNLGGYNDKTVEEVVQQIAGIYATATWKSFAPDGNFSKEIKIVEVDITKKDTLLYSTISIQFIYNKSTGYVQQGAIMINGNECSMMKWWEYYINILMFNQGSYKQKNDEVNSKKSEKALSQQSGNPQREVQTIAEEDKLLVGVLDRPDSNTFFQYTSNEWMDMSKGFEYGAEHPFQEATHIMETASRIIVEFQNKKSLIYEIVSAEPYEYGINYQVEINGKNKTITKSLQPNGNYRFSIEHEWMINNIYEALPAGID